MKSTLKFEITEILNKLPVMLKFENRRNTEIYKVDKRMKSLTYMCCINFKGDKDCLDYQALN